MSTQTTCKICHLPRQTKSGLCFSCLDKAYGQAIKVAQQKATALEECQKLAGIVGAKLAQTAADLEKSLDVLKAIQWSGRSMLRRPICPACQQAERLGHKAECVIGRALNGGTV